MLELIRVYMYVLAYYICSSNSICFVISNIIWYSSWVRNYALKSVLGWPWTFGQNTSSNVTRSRWLPPLEKSVSDWRMNDNCGSHMTPAHITPAMIPGRIRFPFQYDQKNRAMMKICNAVAGCPAIRTPNTETEHIRAWFRLMPSKSQDPQQHASAIGCSNQTCKNGMLTEQTTPIQAENVDKPEARNNKNAPNENQ